MVPIAALTSNSIFGNGREPLVWRLAGADDLDGSVDLAA
jgi:hypothetical protein